MGWEEVNGPNGPALPLTACLSRCPTASLCLQVCPGGCDPTLPGASESSGGVRACPACLPAPLARSLLPACLPACRHACLQNSLDASTHPASARNCPSTRTATANPTTGGRAGQGHRGTSGVQPGRSAGGGAGRLPLPRCLRHPPACPAGLGADVRAGVWKGVGMGSCGSICVQIWMDLD